MISEYPSFLPIFPVEVESIDSPILSRALSQSHSLLASLWRLVVIMDHDLSSLLWLLPTAWCFYAHLSWLYIPYYSFHLAAKPLCFLKDGTEFYSSQYTYWLLLPHSCFYCIGLAFIASSWRPFLADPTFSMREYGFNAFILSWYPIFHYRFEYWNLVLSLPTLTVEFNFSLRLCII